MDVAVFYKLVKTIGMFKRTQSNDCIRLPFMSRLEFHVFDEGDPKIDEIYLTRLMIKSEFSFFDDLSWLLKVGRTNMIYEVNIDYLIQKIVTYAGLDGHLGMGESKLKLKELHLLN